MKIRKIVRLNTPGAQSPAVYDSGKGTYLIQGYKINKQNLGGVENFAPEREDFVEIPKELISLLIRSSS